MKAVLVLEGFGANADVALDLEPDGVNWLILDAHSPGYLRVQLEGMGGNVVLEGPWDEWREIAQRVLDITGREAS